MFPLLGKLRRTRLLSVPGLCRLLEALLTTGANPMALLRFAAKLHPGRIAIHDERERLSYPELWHQAETLAAALQVEHGIRQRQKVAIACRNHAAAVKALFACARLGADIVLINPDTSPNQLRMLDQSQRFDFFIYDDSLDTAFAEPEWRGKSLPAYHATEPSINRLATQSRPATHRLRKTKAGRIVVMTGGTTGQPKAASRTPSVLDFLPPFVALLTQIHLDQYRTVYIATPIYHGFGVAALFLGVLLGVEMYLLRRFDAGSACDLIAQHQIEAVTVVPLMLQRMLNRNAGALQSLRCIISGGALLSPALARQSLAQLGPTLFNLYGTSEGGFAIMATPELLARKPDSIGKPVPGVRAHLIDPAEQQESESGVGRLCLRSSWTTSKHEWIETGDLACRDCDGDLFLRGRVDDMIVSGGENVYPIELENVLAQHPDVAAVGVVGIPDAEFGQRLKAVVALRPETPLDAPALLDWLKPRVARHQMPATVELRDELPYTPLGKLDKNALRG